MSHVRRFDHIGITVADLDTVTAFFVGLGLEVEGTGAVEGEFAGSVRMAYVRGPEGIVVSLFEQLG